MAGPAAAKQPPTAGPVGTKSQPDSCTGERFSDVCPSDWFYSYVTNLANLGAINGYADGTFRPGNTITRGQTMKVLVTALNLQASVPTVPTFEDVPLTQPFYAWIEIGVANGVVNGYGCGAPGEPCGAGNRPYFRPGSNVNRGQLAKMIVNARQWTGFAPTEQTFNDVPPESPFYPFIERVANYLIINGYGCDSTALCGERCPGLYFRPYNTATRAQASKIISGALAGPAATATPVPPIAGPPCAIFPADNIWNRIVTDLPVHPLSAQYIANISLTDYVHPGFGSGLWGGDPIGIPYTTVTSRQACMPINFTAYGSDSDPGPYPVPTNAPIQGGPDFHVLVVDQGTCTLYEMFSAQPQADGSWNARAGARWSLTSNALRPDGLTSANAAGLPILAGLVRYDEVASGAIHHALAFTAPMTHQSHLWPARHDSGGTTDANYPPMGLRVRLKAGIDISGYPASVRVILQAVKDYGMFLVDNGEPWVMAGAPDPRWDNDTLRALHDFHGSDFEAVDEAGLMIDPNSGQSR
jgi:hypothetical protein